MTEENKNIYFEYKKQSLPSEMCGDDNKKIREEFKSFLDEVWQKYKEELPERYWRNNDFIDNDEDIAKKQPFIYFDGNDFKPKNYIGYIKFKDFSFNIYPKICEDEYKNGSVTEEQINQMIFLWMQYSDNVILPKIDASLDEMTDCDFMDFFIYPFAKYTSDLLSVSIYQHYEEISEETPFLKGKLNFNEYIKNCAMGKQHKFHCTYDSFEMNNKFNQIIKYTAKALLNITKNDINTNYLNDIIFKLDEVDDVVCTYSDCEKVYINRFMEDFNTVLDYCKLFLKNSVTFNDFGENNNFAFLFRTELLFEDFITNFAKEKIYDVSILDQSESHLDNDGIYSIKPDLIVKSGDNIKKIIDIKYKEIKNNSDVSNADIYQVLTYAVKLGSSDVTLLYPIFNKEAELKTISVELANGDIINLKFKFIQCCPCKDNEDDIENKIKEQLEKIIKDEEQ